MVRQGPFGVPVFVFARGEDRMEGLFAQQWPHSDAQLPRSAIVLPIRPLLAPIFGTVQRKQCSGFIPMHPKQASIQFR